MLGRYYRHAKGEFQACERAIPVYDAQDRDLMTNQVHEVRNEVVDLMDNLRERMTTFEALVDIEYALLVREKDLSHAKSNGGGLMQEHTLFADAAVRKLFESRKKADELRRAVLGNLKSVQEELKVRRAGGKTSS